jgi:hypothetical protein
MKLCEDYGGVFIKRRNIEGSEGLPVELSCRAMACGAFLLKKMVEYD